MATMSTRKLGAVGSIPVLPMLPIAAQVCKYSSKVHYKMDADGHYLNGSLPFVSPSRIKEVRAAILAQPIDKSYSDTHTKYFALDVEADPANPNRFLVKAGAVVIGYGIIDASAEIVSTDETFAEQTGGDESADADEDGDGDED